MSSEASLSPAPSSLDVDVPLAALAEDASTLEPLLVAIRRHLHRHPELGLQEHRTSRFIRHVLETYGLNVRGPVAQTGLFVDIDGAGVNGESKSRRVGYRADIDALPTQDAKDVPYRSVVPGAAHLCGHDAHTAIGIGVALLLAARRDTLRGGARVFFQPNEEGMPSGAPLMIEDGVLDGLDAVYAIHVDPTLETGRYGLRTGAVTAAADRFKVEVVGTGSGHSARPHEAVDTVWVATQIATALYQLAGRVTDARNATVLTICRFRGGEAYNVIPARVSFGGTLRTTSVHDRPFLEEKIKETAERLAALHGGTAEARFEHGSPPVVNAAEAVEHVEAVVRARRGEAAIHRIPRPSMGAEDFAHYLERIPGALIRAGVSSGPATSFPLHDDRFDLDEAALAPAADLMARVVARHLTAA